MFLLLPSLTLAAPTDDYAVTRFSLAEGLPAEAVSGLEVHGNRLLVSCGAERRWFDGERFWPVFGEVPVADAPEAVDSLGWNPATAEPALWRDRKVTLVEHGRLWLGTADGLYRVAPSAVHQVAPPGASGRVDLAWRDRDERVWQRVPGLGWWSEEAGWMAAKTEAGEPVDLSAAVLVHAPGKPVWVGLDGLYQAASDTLPLVLHPLEGPPEVGMVTAAAVNPGGYVVIGGTHGAARWDGVAWQALPGAVELGRVRSVSQTRDDAGTLVFDDLPGLVWFGDGEARRLRLADGLPSDRVTSARIFQTWDLTTEDRGLCTAVATSSLSELGHGAWSCMGASAGVGSDDVRDARGDAGGRRWVCSSAGLFVSPLEFAERVVADTAAAVPWWPFTARQGLRGRPCPAQGITLPHYGARGELLFASTEGVTRIVPGDVHWPDEPKPWLAAVRSVDGFVDPVTLGALSAEATSATIFVTAPDLGWGPVARLRARVGTEEWRPLDEGAALELSRLSADGVSVDVEALGESGWGSALKLEVARQPRLMERTDVRLFLVGLVLAGVWAAARRGAALDRKRADTLARQVDERTRELSARNAELAANAAELSRRADALAAADVLRNEFVANTAHELRTPLMLILGALEDAAAGVTGPAARHLGLAEQNARRLDEIVTSLLDLARLDRERIPLRARRVDLSPFVGACVARFEGAAARRHVRLAFEGTAGVGAWVDTDFLEKILANLVNNALSFAPEGGKVRVELVAESHGDEAVARITVDDDGPGIPPGERERVFERFVQLDHGDTRRRGGMGIGLALSRALAEAHGGLLLATESPWGGARFVVELPLGNTHLRPEDVAMDAGPAPAPPGPAAATTGVPRLLVVEDHPQMREYLREHLAAAYDVVAVDSGAAALAVVGASAFDAVVSDVMMPEMDGYALCRALAANPATVATPRVLISAKAGPDVDAAAQAVASAFLAKPFRMTQLFDLLATLLPARPVADVGRDAEGVGDPGPASGEPVAPFTPDSETLTRLLRLEAAVDAHLADPAFGVEELARAGALSSRSLQRLLGGLGTTPVRWIRERRLRHAEARLAQGVSVADAAASIGMSRGYFGRVYLAWCGQPAVPAATGSGKVS